MFRYEVNVQVNNEIYDKYYEWLIPHVKELLKFEGFLRAEIGIVKEPNKEETTNICITYTIDTYPNLENYLQHHAIHMRAEAINKFGDNFSVNRRIIKNDLIL